MPFVDVSFNKLVSSSIQPPHSHVILHVGLARSCRIFISKSEGKPSSWRSVPVREIKSFGESALHRPSTNFCNDPSFPGWRGLFVGWWILRLRLRLHAEWQSGRHTSKIESFRIRETKQKGIWCYVYRFLIDASYIVFWLIHVLSIEQERFKSCRLSMHRLMSWFLLPFCHLTPMSFCTQGLPGVAESTFQKVKENLHPWGEVPVRADEECEKVLFHGPQPTYATVPLSRRAKVNLGMWILRLRLLLRAEWLRREIYCEEWKFSE